MHCGPPNQILGVDCPSLSRCCAVHVWIGHASGERNRNDSWCPWGRIISDGHESSPQDGATVDLLTKLTAEVTAGQVAYLRASRPFSFVIGTVSTPPGEQCDKHPLSYFIQMLFLLAENLDFEILLIKFYLHSMCLKKRPQLHFWISQSEINRF